MALKFMKTDLKDGNIQGNISDERLSDYLKCSGDWVWELDREGLITFINGPDNNFLGYELSEILGKPILSFLEKTNSEKRLKSLAGSIAKGKSVINQKVSFVANDGEIIEMLVNMLPVNEEDQKPAGYRGVCKDITWQEILLRSMEDIAKFPEENPSPVFRVTDEGRVIFANLAGEKVLNYWNTTIGQPLPVNVINEMIKGVRKHNEARVSEFTINGNIFAFNSVPVAKAGYINIYGSDITERKKIEKSLKINEERYKLAQVAANIGTWEWDKENSDLYFSDMVGSIFGYLSGTFDGRFRSLWKKIHFKDRTDLLGFFKKLNNMGDSATVDVRVINKDGSLRWVMISGAVIMNRITNKIQITGTVQDITERKKSEEKILTLSMGVEQSPALVLFTDPSGNIQYVNPRFTEVMGYELSEVMGKNPRIFKSGVHNLEFYEHLWETLTAKKNWRSEICNKTKNGDLLWFLSLISPVFDSRGDLIYYLYVAEDITRRKGQEEEIMFRAMHDSLTNLPNRALFKDRLIQVLERYKRVQTDFMIAVLFIDLDKFKPINDICGHSAGDETLKIVSGRIMNSLRKEDTVARIGGDEFAVLVNDISHPDQVKMLAEKILDAISIPLEFENHKFSLSASIGISIFPNDGDDYNTLLVKADKAMYSMKKSENCHIAYYQDGL